MKRFLITVISIVAIVLAPPYAPVRANCFLCSCTVQAVTIQFVNYDFLAPSAIAIASTVTINCQGLPNDFAPFVVKLSTGSSGSFTTRNMSAGLNKLHYNLYTDAGHTQVWGDGSSGTGKWSSSVSLGRSGTASSSTTVYALISPASQPLARGTYTDSVTQTITY